MRAGCGRGAGAGSKVNHLPGAGICLSAGGAISGSPPATGIKALALVLLPFRVGRRNDCTQRVCRSSAARVWGLALSADARSETRIRVRRRRRPAAARASPSPSATSPAFPSTSRSRAWSLQLTRRYLLAASPLRCIRSAAKTAPTSSLVPRSPTHPHLCCRQWLLLGPAPLRHPAPRSTRQPAQEMAMKDLIASVAGR